MRKLLLALSTVLTVGLSAQPKDASLFGYKGKVKTATVKTSANDLERFSIRFDDNGGIVGEYTDYEHVSGMRVQHQLTKRTRNSITGLTLSEKFTMTIANNRITKTVYRGDDNYSLTRTFTYNTDGRLTKIDEVEVSYTTEVVLNNGFNDAQRIANDVKSDAQQNANTMMSDAQQNANELYADIMRNPLDYEGAANRAAERNNAAANRAAERNNAAANRAANRINAAASRMGPRERKVKHTNRATITFSNYQFDDFGNWTSRTVTDKDGVCEESQIIEYDKEFWSQFYWERLHPTGDLRRIEAFALNQNCSDNYKKLASNFWNERILAEVERVDKNNRDTLCHVAKSRIISETNKEKALNIVREDLYANVVMPIRDYARVDGMKNMSYNDFSIFDNIYKKKIEQLSQQLRQDSITFLSGKAKKEFEVRDYVSAEKTCKGLLIIDPANSLAKEISQEANYQIVLTKEANNTVNENDYTNFIEQYSYSSHMNEILDKRALYASSLFNKLTSEEELDRVHNLQTVDQKATKTVNKRYRKWMFKKNHGRFFRIGLGGEFGVGGANAIASGELGVRLGYTANLINGTIGFKYNYLTSTSQMFEKPKEVGDAFFERHYLSVPLMLRFNLKHGYHGSTYVGLGAELNVANLKTLLRDVNEYIKEKEFAKKDMSLSPRIAFGGYLVGIEVELFATYDNENHFNKDYIETYQLNGQPVKNVCNEKSYQKQVEPKDFLDKIHGGLAIRLWF